MTNLLNQTLIFIGSSILLVPIFHRLGFGSVLGYLLAGTIVGPHALGLIKDTESIIHFSEFGVVLLLFVIGLEVQPRKLWAMKGNLAGLGGVQVVLSTIVFGFIGMALGLSTVSALVIGFSLSLSSTAFALQTLTENNNFNTEFGKGSFSILLMQDLLAIPALAIIPSLGIAQSNVEHPTYLFPVLVVSLFLASRLLFRPFFRVIASTHSREIFTASALFIVLGVAYLMLQIGLSAALGTFIAGVLLADSEYRHELEANIEPFKSLLMGLFFIAIGMTVNLHLVFSRFLFIFFFTIGYLVLKWAVIYLCGRLLKMNHENSKRMGLTIAQGGEFAFVIFGIAASSQLIQAEYVDILTAVITLSMALNPLVTAAYEKILATRKLPIVEPKYDHIKNEYPQVIIGGFGRFGQMFGRIFRAQGIPFVAIDHDTDQVELIRKFGNKVYYGDISRVDLLEAAGAGKAKYLVLAVDDSETSLRTVRNVKEHFPHLEVFARARNRGHAFDLMDLGVTHIKRETFDSSVNFVGELLVDLGYSKDKVTTLIERFKVHDEVMLFEQYKVRDDDKMFLSQTQQSNAQLEKVLNDDTTKSYIR